jgi:hypothetical protein
MKKKICIVELFNKPTTKKVQLETYILQTTPRLGKLASQQILTYSYNTAGTSRNSLLADCPKIHTKLPRRKAQRVPAQILQRDKGIPGRNLSPAVELWLARDMVRQDFVLVRTLSSK